MRSLNSILIGACLGASLLGGCSPTGIPGSVALLGSALDAQEEASPALASAPDAEGEPAAASQVQSYAAADSGQSPRLASTGGGLAGLFGAFRTEPPPLPEPPPPPGEFIAPEQALLPTSRPDYGDRPKVDLAALATAEAARVAQIAVAQAPGAPAAPVRAQALARSLDAYERREAGIPDDDDEIELEQLAGDAQTNGQAEPAQANAQANPAAQKMAFGYTPAHFEISGVQPLPLQGAKPTGASARSSNGLALQAPAQRWRAAYDNVETACFPQQLRNALNTIAAHFNAEVLVTSGARGKGRRGSLHRSCKAADIRIAGVSPADLAAYARTVPGLNGVGAYRRVSVTHIDVRDERFAWRW